MLFATYQSADVFDKTDRPDYSIWALPVTSVADFFVASCICAPNRSDVLVFFETDDYKRIDKVAWYQGISRCEDYNTLNPMDYVATADLDDLHSEFLVKCIDKARVKRVYPIFDVGDELDILGYGIKSEEYKNVAWMLREKARVIMSYINPPIERNILLGMSREVAEYRAVIAGKKAAFELIYLPIAVDSVLAGTASFTFDVVYYSNMISYNFYKIAMLSDKFAVWSYGDCSLDEYDVFVEQLRHCVIDSPVLMQRLLKGPPIGRNEPCPCCSGKKWKKCHGLWLD